MGRALERVEAARDVYRGLSAHECQCLATPHLVCRETDPELLKRSSVRPTTRLIPEV
jgi:hypothetical protein